MSEPLISGYEFTDSQNKRVNSLVNLMRFLAYSLFLGGAMQALLMCLITAGSLDLGVGLPKQPLMVTSLGGILAMVLALRLVSASREFVEIVKSRGKDIDHLMAALQRLQDFFGLSAFLLWGMVVLLLGVVLY